MTFKTYEFADKNSDAVLIFSEEKNTDLRDELAYNLFVDRKAEEIKDEFYIDEVYGENEY